MEQGARLPKLPHEVLHNIFKHVQPIDLAVLSATCKELHRFVGDNRPLFRAVYLSVLDEPPDRPNAVQFDWIAEVHKYVKMRNILKLRERSEEKSKRLTFVANTVSSWMHTSSSISKGKSQNIKLLTDLFASKSNQEAFLQHSTIFARARRDRALQSSSANPCPLLSLVERQSSAKLHTLYGVPIELPRRTSSHGIYPFACSVVYDLRNYTEENFWGPYRNDGLCTADWERLEAIMIVLGHNLRLFSQNTHGMLEPLWAVPWMGASPDSFAPLTISMLKGQPAPPPNALDPFNIGGTWMRVVCFLDFSELFAYNFNSQPPAANEPRRPIETTEAIRLIIMEIEVDFISHVSENEGLSPIVHFKGMSRSMHSQWDPNANSSIRGTVRMTKEGEVRWTSISVYQGEERWKSEGIQIGGPKSSRGVLGHWFDKDHDHHGPAGPTAFWKVSNDITTDMEKDFGDGHGVEAEAEVDVDDEEDTEYEGEEIHIEQLSVQQIAAVLGSLAGAHT